MRAPLSIIIPTLEAAGQLPGCLAALTEGLDAGLIRELVLSDGGSRDDTVAIGDAAGAVIVAGDRGRGSQLARGAAAAGGHWYLFLHADSWLEQGWSTVVQDHMTRYPSQAAAFRLAFRAEGAAPRWVAGWANLRSRWLGLPYGDQGLLIPRDLYLAAGGYPAIPLMEDVALARALAGRVRLLPAVIRTGADRYETQGWARRGARNLWTLLRYVTGTDPERLARDYRR